MSYVRHKFIFESGSSPMRKKARRSVMVRGTVALNNVRASHESLPYVDSGCTLVRSLPRSLMSGVPLRSAESRLAFATALDVPARRNGFSKSCATAFGESHCCSARYRYGCPVATGDTFEARVRMKQLVEMCLTGGCD